MIDRKKKAIDYLNSRKVKRNVGEWFLIVGLIITGIVLLLMALPKIIE